MKKTVIVASLLLALLMGRRAHAQLGGCDDSPENPTLILATMAGGGFAASALRRKVRASRRNKGRSAPTA